MSDGQNHGPCWPWCKDYIKEFTQLQIKRIESILEEREKATILLAQTEITRREGEMLEKFVLRQTHEKEIQGLQDQLTGRLGIELRIRQIEQDKGAIDAKLYMVIIGIPLAVTGLMFFFMNHILKGN